MKKTILLTFFTMALVPLFAQEASLTLTTSKDTVLMGNVLKVTYTLKQVKSDAFKAPDFQGFTLVSGPNTSMSMSFVNGEMSRESAYSFYLRPENTGVYSIPEVSVETEKGILSAGPKQIVVLPNPDGIIEEPETDNPTENFDFFRPFFDESPRPAPKPKRKTYKL